MQLPLALDKILAGESPYGADYSDSILGQAGPLLGLLGAASAATPSCATTRTSRAPTRSSCPSTSLAKATLGVFDARFVTLARLRARQWCSRPSSSRAPPARPRRRRRRGPQPPRLLAPDLRRQRPPVRGPAPRRPGSPPSAEGQASRGCCSASPARPSNSPGPSPRSCCSISPGARAVGRAPRPRGLEAPTRTAWRSRSSSSWRSSAPWPPSIRRPSTRTSWSTTSGLPGGDNYPLGGTPGFGFANFLIYFGRVSSLREYFPFGVFYVFLVPLGLALVHAQLREPGLPRAFLNGSAALLASLYFSRVVHPNYLIPLAVLLPIAAAGAGTIGGRRGRAALPSRGGRPGRRERRLPAHLGSGGRCPLAQGPDRSRRGFGAALGLRSHRRPHRARFLGRRRGSRARLPDRGRPSRRRPGCVSSWERSRWCWSSSCRRCSWSRIGDRTRNPRAGAWVVQAQADAARLARRRQPFCGAPGRSAPGS